MDLGDRCERCGQPSQVIAAMVRLPDGSWIRIYVHIACENNVVAKNRLSGMAGRN
jgi:uncharacterized OB-fold protein